ncbi:MAG: hypothetical protein Ct9H300mP21_00240 [Pseudomonadota bacterium]|nr:MAG: hypothetical protein Ct9H300mP21_00240 [Pseudomonadota bacterium]
MLTIVSWNIQYGKGVDGDIDLSRIAREILIDGFPGFNLFTGSFQKLSCHRQRE